MSCAAALPQLDRGSDYESERHRFESYTPHQSNLKPPATGAFLLWQHRMDSNLGRGAGVKKTRSVFSPRASTPAGGRSRCGSAQRMRGILYAAPLEFEASGNGGFSFTSASHGFEPRSRRERQENAERFSPRASTPEGGRSRYGSAQRMRGILYAAPIELKASGNGGFSFMATPHGFEPRSRRVRLNHHFVKFFQIVA